MVTARIKRLANRHLIVQLGIRYPRGGAQPGQHGLLLAGRHRQFLHSQLCLFEYLIFPQNLPEFPQGKRFRQKTIQGY